MWIDVVSKMVLKNQDVRLAPMGNIEEISTRKCGFGYVKIAIPNELAQNLLAGDKYNGGLLLFDIKQYKEAEKELKERDQS